MKKKFLDIDMKKARIQMKKTRKQERTPPQRYNPFAYGQILKGSMNEAQRDGLSLLDTEDR